MEAIQNYILPHLPESLQSLQHLQSLHALTTTVNAYLQPYVIIPAKEILATSAGTFNFDLTSIALVLVILLLSLRILDHFSRMVIFWVTLVFRLAYWTLLIGGVLYVYTVGWEQASQQVGYLIGLVQGFVQNYFDETQKQAMRDQSRNRGPKYW